MAPAAAGGALAALLARARHLLGDASAVASALAAARPSTVPSARSVLMGLARGQRPPNSVAASLLRADRELGLVRYHGLYGYVERAGGVRSLLLRLPPPPGAGAGAGAGAVPGRDGRGGSGDGGDAAEGDGEGRTKARVAFMITAAQRSELSAGLGYGDDEIRKLRPLEALLILQHQVGPGNEAKVRRLVEDNDELQRREEEEEERRRAREKPAEAATTAEGAGKEEKEGRAEEKMSVRKRPEPRNGGTLTDASSAPSALALVGASSADAAAAEASPLDGTSQPPMSFQREEGGEAPWRGPLDGGGASKLRSTEIPLNGAAVPSRDQVGGGDCRAWFEVVEIRQSSETSEGDAVVVALYESEEEARDCVDWKQKRGRGGVSYGIRQRGNA